MKRIVLVSLSFSLLFTSCIKDAAKRCTYSDSSASATSTERAFIRDYLTSHTLTATELPSGVFYNITSNGTGDMPQVCSQVTVNYKGYLLGTLTPFDSNETTSGTNFVLGGLIVGWQKGLSILKGGGSITLYVPPSLGYGSTPQTNNGVVVIPANSYLQFDIDLLGVVNL